MAPDLEIIRRIRQKAEDQLFARTGVTGIDIGYKYKDAVAGDEVAVRIYVEKKVPSEHLAPGEALPSEIEGVPIDVIERTFEWHHGPPPYGAVHADTGRYDPLAGGISIGPCRRINGQHQAGTLGACVVDRASGATLFLSSFHTLAADIAWQAGDPIAQPSRVDGGVCPDDVAGRLERAVLTDQVDGAVATPSGRPMINTIVSIGAVAGKKRAALGDRVRKRGRTTALTFGIVDSVDLTIRVNIGAASPLILRNQIGIAVDRTRSVRFGLPGDSGAVVVAEDSHVVGLYVAGSTDGAFGVANHIDAVLATLDVDLCVTSFKAAGKEKPEKLEAKEKPEKLEAKEKPEKWEGKEKPEKWEGKPEKGEKAEKNEKIEGKPEKPEPGESKGWTPKDHTDWEIWRWKQIHNKEPGKESETKVGDIGPLKPGKPEESEQEQIEKLGAEIGRLRHFIALHLRPDLSEGALKWEPDIPAPEPRGPASVDRPEPES